MFVGLATLYNAVTPLGEGPDEPGHGQYVLFLAREGRLPVQCAAPCVSEVPGSGHHPPLAYLLATPLVSWLPREERRIDLPGNRRFTWTGGDQANALGHGTRERWPWSREVLAWHLARLASTAAGAATVVLTYLTARKIDFGLLPWHTIHLSRSRAALLAAALVALNPQFIFTSALISNDALLAALSAALLWLVIDQGPRTETGGPRAKDQGLRAEGRRFGFWSFVFGLQSLPRAAAVGLMLGLALLTKASALLLVPVALGWALLDQRPGPAWRPLRQPRWSSMRHWAFRSLTRALLVLGVAAATAGWWYARNLELYGDLLGLDMFRAEFATQPFDPLSPAAWMSALTQLYTSSWARFGWMNVTPPAWVDWVYGAVGAAACVGLALRLTMDRGTGAADRGLAAVDQGQATGRGPDTSDSLLDHSGQGQPAVRLSSLALSVWPLLALPALALAWVLSFALTAGLVAWQGRLMFPATSAAATLMAWGLLGWTTGRGPWTKSRGRPSRRVALGLSSFVVGLGTLAIWLPFGVIRPAYPSQALAEAEALGRLGTPVYGRFARTDEAGAELRGWEVTGEARPGEALELRLTWHALGPQNRDWWAFVHLEDAEEGLVAEANAEVGGGVFPMLHWRAGDWAEDHHRLEIPPELPPGTYALRVGLWYPETGRRARMYDREGELAGDSVVLTQIEVRR
jgi:hypothetical protein